MKKIKRIIKLGVFLILLGLFVSACANSEFASDQVNDQIDFGEEAAVPLSDLDLDMGDFKVVSSDQVDWEDTCLGIDQPGYECQPVVTPGYLVVLEGNGLQFNYHADQKGNQVHPATMALVWTREGGESGSCDKLIIYLPDTIHACWCKDGKYKKTTAILQDILSIEEYEQLINALRKFDTTTMNSPSSSDMENVAFSFYGQGNRHPDNEQEAKLLTIAETIFTRLSP